MSQIHDLVPHAPVEFGWNDPFKKNFGCKNYACRQFTACKKSYNKSNNI